MGTLLCLSHHVGLELLRPFSALYQQGSLWAFAIPETIVLTGKPVLLCEPGAYKYSLVQRWVTVVHFIPVTVVCILCVLWLSCWGTLYCPCLLFCYPSLCFNTLGYCIQKRLLLPTQMLPSPSHFSVELSAGCI